jgi:peptidyl-prolyl cis-trans isomerase C
MRTIALALSLALATGVNAAEEVAATVNGKPITNAAVDAVFAEQTNQQITREQVVSAMVVEEALIQEAERVGLTKDPKVASRIERQRRSLVASLMVQDHLEKNPVTDEEIQKTYDEVVAAEKGQEYKARHILVEEETMAKSLIDELAGGADFAELAKKHSTGPTGTNGGDLGWFSAKTMVAPFAEAVQAMEKGAVSKSPVKTQFGWHVILLEDSRDIEPPALDQLRPRIESFIKNRRNQEYMQSVREKAEVKIH